MSLMDILKPEMQGAAQSAQTGLGQTQDIQKLVAAKSGQAATPSSAPAQSSLTEAINANAANQQVAAQNQTGQMNMQQQQQESLNTQQKQQQQQQQFTEQASTQKDQFNNQMASLLDNYANQSKQIKTSQDIENMEQAGFAIRLNSQQYVDQLKLQGQKARLDDMTNFKTQVMQDAFSDSEGLLKDQNVFQSVMNADDRTFQKELQGINANIALQIFNQNLKGQQANSMWASYGTAAQGALGGIGVYMANSGSSQPSATTPATASAPTPSNFATGSET